MRLSFSAYSVAISTLSSTGILQVQSWPSASAVNVVVLGLPLGGAIQHCLWVDWDCGAAGNTSSETEEFLDASALLV